MIERRPFDSLGGADHGWLDAKHHFSFADYHDPAAHGLGRAARLERRHDRAEDRLPAAPARGHGDHHLRPRRRDHPPGQPGQQGPHRGRRRAGDERRHRHRATPSTTWRTSTTRIFQIWIIPDQPRRGADLGRQALPQGRPRRPVRDARQRHRRRRRRPADPHRRPRAGRHRSRPARPPSTTWARAATPIWCRPRARSRSTACASTPATARRSATSARCTVTALEDAEVVLVDAPPEARRHEFAGGYAATGCPWHPAPSQTSSAESACSTSLP